jgi:hypothetical protein
VAGIDDFKMFTILFSRPGWLKRIQLKWTYFSELHQPPRPDIYISARLMVLLSGHPSLKKGGETFVLKTP